MDNLEIIDVEQGTPEWLAARAGVITASCVADVMAQPMKGKTVSLVRSKYMRILAAEQITGEPCQVFAGNADTERGKILEPKARELYELQTGYTVEQVGFMKLGKLGCSPDGLIGDDGGCEIKCKRGDIHIDVLENDEVPAEHIKQIQFSLMVTGRKWWDFISYSPGLPLFTKRVYPDAGLHEIMRNECDAFLEDLAQLVERVNNYGMNA